MESAFGSPSEYLLEAWLEGAPTELGDRGQVLTNSFVGLFEVVELLPGVGCWLRDMAGFGSYALAHPSGGGQLQTGDLLVGRLFPIEDGLHCASSAAAIFRSADLAAALEIDLGEIRAKSTGKVLRLSQDGLEKMFWGSGHAPTSEDPVGDLRCFLSEEAQLPPHRISSIVTGLAEEPFDPENLTPGAGDPLGAILDDLAFGTDVNLDTARQQLILAWQKLSLVDQETNPDTQKTAGDDHEPGGPIEAVARFESGRLAGLGVFDCLRGALVCNRVGLLRAVYNRLEGDLVDRVVGLKLGPRPFACRFLLLAGFCLQCGGHCRRGLLHL